MTKLPPDYTPYQLRLDAAKFERTMHHYPTTTLEDQAFVDRYARAAYALRQLADYIESGAPG